MTDTKRKRSVLIAKIFAAMCVAALLPLLAANCGGGGGNASLSYVPANMAQDCSSGRAAGREAAQTANYSAVQCLQIHQLNAATPIPHGTAITVSSGGYSNLQAVVYDYGCGDLTSNFVTGLSWTVSNPAIGTISIGGDHSTATFNANAVAATATGTITVTLYHGMTVVKSDTIDVTVLGPTTPNAPTGLTATAGNAQVALTWTAPAANTDASPLIDLAGYEVFQATVSGGPYTLVTATSGTNYTVTGLTNGTTYYFVVRAFDTELPVNPSAYSTEVNAAPTAGPTVTATPSSTNVTLSGGTASITLTCTTGGTGTVTSLEGRCDTTDPWATITLPGTTRTCTYTSANTYTPGCRVNGTTSSNSAPVTVAAAGLSYPALPRVEAGSSHTCFANTSGAVKCMGWGGNGQLGNSASSDSNVPVQVTGLTSGAYDIGAGEDHSCAIVTGGAVMCWGGNTNGQLGNNSTVTSNSPVVVNGGTFTGAVRVEGGFYYTCALKSDGTVWCWGKNTSGQLGDGSTTESHIPVQVTGITTAVDIEAGDSHACAQLSSGTIMCWGANAMGQLGNNSTVNSSSPVSVTGGAIFSTTGGVGAGSTLSCGPSTATGLQCWGSDANGQLGDGGANTDSLVPVAVAVIATAVSDTTGGGGHGCALTSAGAVYCWGDNFFGQVGDGTSGNSYGSPVSASGLASVTSISAGGYHTCAATATGIYCWGDNSMGEIGDGTNTNRSTPTAAIYP